MPSRRGISLNFACHNATTTPEIEVVYNNRFVFFYIINEVPSNINLIRFLIYIYTETALGFVGPRAKCIAGNFFGLI